MRRGHVVVPLLATSIFALGTAAVAATREYPFGPFGVFTLDVPGTWSAEVQGADAPGEPAIRMTPDNGREVVLLVTALPPGEDVDLSEAVRQYVETFRGNLLEIAEETEVPIRELHGRGGRVLFVTITDKTVTKPTADDFKYGTQGCAEVGRLMVPFTFLANDPDAPELQEALEIVGSAGHAPPHAPQASRSGVPYVDPTDRFRLFLPEDWEAPPSDPDVGYPVIAGPEGSLVLIYDPDAPPGLPLSACMEGLHLGIEEAFREREVSRSLDFVAGRFPARLTLHSMAGDPRLPVEPVCGCVVLGDAVFQVTGLAEPEDGAAETIRDIVATFEPISEDRGP